MGNIVAAAERDGSQMVIADLDIRKEPDPQYGADAYMGMHSMRQIRMCQRRPETYKLVANDSPPIMDRYARSSD